MGNQVETAAVAYGRAVAAMISASFGCGWLGWGFAAIPGLPGWIWLGYSSVATALVAIALAALRRGGRIVKAQPGAWSSFWQQRRRAYRLLTVVEALGCGIVVLMANLLRRPDWIAVGLSLVVGLHFLPLGRILGAASYYWVGSLIVVCDILTVTALKWWNPTATAGVGTGVVLWAGSVYALVQSFRVTAPNKSS